MIRCAVVQFPGSNCDRDCVAALESFDGVAARLVWHKETSLSGYDVIVLPGGFSYGDYLRCGAIARFSPVMHAVRQAAHNGRPVLGICNGFQILCEAGLLPGALVRNRSLNFICRHIHLRVETSASLFTHGISRGAVLQIPIAHGEGCYFADADTLARLNENQQILFRYCDSSGAVTPDSNPNGSLESVAGICNEKRNVLGMMPHPERVCDPLLGGTDGRRIFDSVFASLASGADPSATAL